MINQLSGFFAYHTHPKDLTHVKPKEQQLIPLEPSDDLIPPRDNDVVFVGQVANDHAAQGVFIDYLSRKDSSPPAQQEQ
jgi:hypothetical protein